MDTSDLNLSYITVNDYSFAYRVTSHQGKQKPPLILVHGHISDLRSWLALEPFLAPHFTVYSYSRRYAWPNEPIGDKTPQPWEQDAADLIGLITGLDIAPCHALGNSSGAFTILLAARTHAHLFRTLLLEEPPVIPLFLPTLPPTILSALDFLVSHPISFWPVMYYGATTIGPTIAAAKAATQGQPPSAATRQEQHQHERVLDTFGPGVLGARFWTRATKDPARRQQLEDNAKWLRNFFAYNTIPKYTAADAAKVQLPTLVLTGTHGPWSQQCVDAELFRVLGSTIRKERAWIQGAGHLMHEDEPELVAEKVRMFVDSVE